MNYNFKAAMDSAVQYIKSAEKCLLDTDLEDKLDIIKECIEVEKLITDLVSKMPDSPQRFSSDTKISALLSENIFSVRLANVLLRAQYETIGDITNHTENEVKFLRNMGRRSFAELGEFMDENGFCFKPEKKEQKDVKVCE